MGIVVDIFRRLDSTHGFIYDHLWTMLRQLFEYNMIEYLLKSHILCMIQTEGI
jgi:hypothetical protein